MGSKRKHRHRDDEYDNNDMYNNPFGIDMNQLMGMLGGVDKNTLNNMINNLNSNGVNMENLNLNNMMNQNTFNNGNQSNQSNQGSMDPMAIINNLMNQNNINNNNNNAFKQGNNSIKHNYENETVDPNIEMLLSVRKIVNEDRKIFIDKVIKLYKEGVFGN